MKKTQVSRKFRRGKGSLAATKVFFRRRNDFRFTAETKVTPDTREKAGDQLKPGS
jgi:hypothetical protein